MNTRGIEYLVSSVNTNIYTSTGKIVPLSLAVTVDGLGTSNTNYFTARDNTNASIYKKLVGDTLVGDQMLLVGFIKQNNPTGTAAGIDGSITIKAYLDENKILISDTYNNGATPTDNLGTPASMGEGKTVFTTTEWNALSSTGLSFKVKVEAREGIWVNGPLEEIMRKTAVMDNTTSTYVSSSTGINFASGSGDTNGKGVYMRAGTQNDPYPIMYFRGAVEDNNVKFANQCWKVVRTTDTGGVKLVYNGEFTEQNKCNNTISQSKITLNGTSTFAFNTSSDSPAYNGYMYGDVYTMNNEAPTSYAYYGSSFTWDGTYYKLVDAVDSINGDNRHYTCNLTAADGMCTTLRYYFVYASPSYYYYINLTGGDGIEEALTKMQTNTNDSNAKDKIDTWFEINMTNIIDNTKKDYRPYLEDTVWCNDRSMGNNNNGWIANGGSMQIQLLYATATKNQPTLVCSNKNDRFTVYNGNGNQALDYPIALLTADEIALSGYAFPPKSNSNVLGGGGGGGGGGRPTSYLNGATGWTLSPIQISDISAYVGIVGSSSKVGTSSVDSSSGEIRPSISLKPGTPVVGGTGTALDPYVIG